MTRILTIAALTLAAAGCASQSGQMSKAPPVEDRGTGLNSIDQPFVRDTLEVAAFEMEASKMALDRSDDEGVKKIARQVIREQQEAVAKLTKISQEHDQPFAAKTDYEQDQSIERLKTLNGKDFDAEYLRQMSRTHREAIAQFLSESQYGTDKDVKSFTDERLPQLEAQQKMIRGETGEGTASERE